MSELDVRRFLGALAEMEIDSYFYDEKGMETLQSLRNQVMKCERCALSKTRKNIVFGEGNDAAALLFVGEAPGKKRIFKGGRLWGKRGKCSIG
jgi:DNA polymerase